MSELRPSRSKRPRSTQNCGEDTTDDRPRRINNVHESVHERVSHVADLLQEWSWSFPQLVKYWIDHNNGARGKRRTNKKLGILRTLFTDDSEAIIKDIRDDPIMVDIMDVAIEYLVHGIRAEFGELRRLFTFGQWKADEDVRQLDMSMMGKELSEHAPLFTNLMTELACNTSAIMNGYVRKEEEGYLVMLASILLLKSSRNTANRFARMLGFYLQGSGVKRRTIEVPDGLGVTECYWTLRNTTTDFVYRCHIHTFV
ncbi:uncharacterized protein N7515_007175 [Penicillium bovifimosum]|uniref:Uncharacterized protein n=1 Tax=Penicillium bovifimosum TaxID=126998 RepID=A0A9W9L1E8_9EURO|nr:uncharacterized protein N7515_007175 [Penicillium bovifimosum]KAJ5131136.1 hypothetical protein N7515_007175 [Penicillium bovifimosum]